MKKLLLISLVLFAFTLTSLYLFTSSGPVMKRTAHYLSTNYLEDLDLDWSKLSIEVKNTFSSKRIYEISYNDGCIEYPNIFMCLEKLYIQIELNILNPLNSRVKELIVRSSKFHIKATKEKQAKAPLALNIKETLQQIHNYYSSYKSYFPQGVELILNDFVITEQNSKTSLKLKLNKKMISLAINTTAQKISLQLHKSSKLFTGQISLASSEMKIITNIDLTLNENIEIKTHNKVEVNSLKSKPVFNIDLSLNQDSSSVTLYNGSFSYQGIVFKTNTCDIKVNYNSASDYLSFICDKLLVNIKDKLSLKTNIVIELLNKIDFSKDQLLASNSLKIKNIEQESFNLSLNTLINLKTVDQKISILYDEFTWQLKSQKFNKLVDKLEGTAFAIPAPINTMEGEILLSSQQIFKLNENNIIIPLTADINIDDKTKNRLKLKFNGELFYSNEKEKKPKFTGELLLDDIRINIPRIDPIGGIPTLSSSSRINKELKIVKKKKKKKKKKNFLYDLKINSKSDEAIKIYYYLFHPHFSFGVRAHATNDFVTYRVYSNNKMKIKYLKREVVFENLVLSSKKDDKATLDTTFNYYAAGYKLILNVIGTFDSPKLILKSYPSLPREDIISLLIYNRKATSISSVQKQSVGGTQAAIADKALSLFSIWAFASTPIDYVSYNPASKSYSASISLPGNTSFQIGTDWESINNLTLRKQLSDTWAIETSYNPNQENAKQNVMLQKEINF